MILSGASYSYNLIYTDWNITSTEFIKIQNLCRKSPEEKVTHTPTKYIYIYTMDMELCMSNIIIIDVMSWFQYSLLSDLSEWMADIFWVTLLHYARVHVSNMSPSKARKRYLITVTNISSAQQSKLIVLWQFITPHFGTCHRPCTYERPSKQQTYLYIRGMKTLNRKKAETNYVISIFFPNGGFCCILDAIKHIPHNFFGTKMYTWNGKISCRNSKIKCRHGKIKCRNSKIKCRNG